jgi:hypothetical protein
VDLVDVVVRRDLREAVLGGRRQRDVGDAAVDRGAGAGQRRAVGVEHDRRRAVEAGGQRGAAGDGDRVAARRARVGGDAAAGDRGVAQVVGLDGAGAHRRAADDDRAADRAGGLVDALVDRVDAALLEAARDHVGALRRAGEREAPRQLQVTVEAVDDEGAGRRRDLGALPHRLLRDHDRAILRDAGGGVDRDVLEQVVARADQLGAAGAVADADVQVGVVDGDAADGLPHRHEREARAALGRRDVAVDLDEVGGLDRAEATAQVGLDGVDQLLGIGGGRVGDAADRDVVDATAADLTLARLRGRGRGRWNGLSIGGWGRATVIRTGGCQQHVGRKCGPECLPHGLSLQTRRKGDETRAANGRRARRVCTRYSMRRRSRDRGCDRRVQRSPSCTGQQPAASPGKLEWRRVRSRRRWCVGWHAPARTPRRDSCAALRRLEFGASCARGHADIGRAWRSLVVSEA